MIYILETVIQEHGTDRPSVWLRKQVNFQPTTGLHINSSEIGLTYLLEDEKTIVGEFKEVRITTDFDKTLEYFLSNGWMLKEKFVATHQPKFELTAAQKQFLDMNTPIGL